MHTENNNKDLAFKDEKPSACIRMKLESMKLSN